MNFQFIPYTVKPWLPNACSILEHERISSLKRLVSEKLNVPVSQQRLLFKGKALAGGCQCWFSVTVLVAPYVRVWQGQSYH
uniref:Ubiquitin-like domain-containing protein n=1 Tax=Podarcis muralis TaxID=64176 RepID=A0A670KJ60_PODMU